LSEVDLFIGGVVMPLLYVIAHGVVVCFLLILLLMVNLKLAITVGFLLCSAYAFFHLLFRKRMSDIGRERVAANGARFSIVSETFGGIKEVKVSGLEDYFSSKFEVPAKKFSRNQIIFQLTAQIPRFVIEVLAFGGLSLLILYLILESGSFSAAMPVIALYAYAGYKLMPALQQIYSYGTQLRFSLPVLDSLYFDLSSLNKGSALKNLAPIYFDKNIKFKNVSYTYVGESAPIIKNVSFDIPSKKVVAFVGLTGSGKSTILDLLLGLHEPMSGTISVDGVNIFHENVGAWQKNIGYVPQSIYLTDGTMAENIAFGVLGADIDYEVIKKVARIANIDHFIEGLSLSYGTVVGERGVRLSGGQRQRIGIARALYRAPKILVLDEATSALDNITEKCVMESIYKLSQNITVVIVAHRLSTVQLADIIFVVDAGKIVASGPYADLVYKCPEFKAIVDATSSEDRVIQ
jgi:ABC-type multidrug transport system fused ATPase/permease subunit